MTSPLLQLTGVHTHIGAYHILHGVDLEVPAGQVTMLLGRLELFSILVLFTGSFWRK